MTVSRAAPLRVWTGPPPASEYELTLKDPARESDLEGRGSQIKAQLSQRVPPLVPQR